MSSLFVACVSDGASVASIARLDGRIICRHCLLHVCVRWRQCRVFISSTFVDMHAERNLLSRFVLPELSARARRLFVNVRDVDLRWGVSQADAQSHR